MASCCPDVILVPRLNGGVNMVVPVAFEAQVDTWKVIQSLKGL